jgi:hypothetical protein
MMANRGTATHLAKVAATGRNITMVIVTVIASVLMLIAIGATAAPPLAQQKASVPKPQDKVALGEDDVKQLLLLMDTDKNGKISKKEYMAFMEAEFDRLDKNKSGDLDVKELTQSRLSATHPALVGK